jgi:LacI family transcriptional regulator
MASRSGRTNPRHSAIVTQREVAAQSGVSRATVSIVLNNAPLARYISPQTRERIQKVAQKLGYRPIDPFCTPILRGIESAFYQTPYLPILTDAHNERTRFEGYLEMLLDRHVEGLIIVANWLFVDVELLADLEKRNIPAVIIGRQLRKNSISSIMVDNEAGASLALEHLYTLGHRDIAFIRGPKMLGDTSPRWRGIRNFARAHGLRLHDDLVLDLPDSFDPKSAFEHGARLTEELLRRKRHFSAIMAFDDMTALGAMRALEKSGVSVPGQCSVIGFDDVTLAAVSVPPLTTVRQPMQEMGAAAVRIVLEGITAVVEQRDYVSIHEKLAPELVVRESTRPK